MIPKLQTAKEKEKKERKKKRLFTVIIVVVLLASTAAFALNSFQKEEGQEAVKYGKFKFFKAERGWQTTVNDVTLKTIFLPADVENITSGKIDILALKGKVYFVAATNTELQAAYELDSVLAAEKKQLACLPEYENESTCENLPLKSCEDANSEQAIVVFRENNANNTAANYSDYCLTIEGSNEELVKAADKVIFTLFGIIK